jgi:HEPN domain-containing protein
MPPDAASYPRRWVRIADKDLDRVGRSLRDGDAALAGFCLQQAVEKLLKAFLLANGWSLRRIHDLEALLDDAAAIQPALERFREPCQTITKYYLLERYPFADESELEVEEVRASLDTVRGLISALRAGVP